VQRLRDGRGSVLTTRALVTGGTGFVGANLVRRLLRDGHDVHLLVRPGHAEWRLDEIRPDVTLHVANLTDADALASIVDLAKPAWIFHLAAHGAYSWQRDARQMVDTNVTGTLSLLDACLRHDFDAFVNSGSSSEYGFKDHPPAEDEPLLPNSHYAVTKAAASMLCRFLGVSDGRPIRTLRLYSAFGPYEDPQRLMPTLISHALHGQLPPLVDPETARDYVYVEDACDAFVRAAAQPGQAPGAVYNIGSGVQTSLREVVEAARRLFEVTAEPRWGSMPPRSWDTSCWVADPRLARERLQWQATHTVEQGMALTARWFNEHPELRRVYQPRVRADP
jgi:nucleoside-diphosphate-sugar epimerase